MTLLVRPSFEEFCQRADAAAVVPVHTELLADLLTPVEAAHRLRGRVRKPFLLESVEGGAHIGRYSYLGGDPFLELRGDADGLERIDRDGSRVRIEGDPVAALDSLLAAHRSVPDPELPPFTGGAVGAVGYEAVRWVERVPAPAASAGLPWLALGLYDTVAAFDHLRNRLHLIASVRVAGISGIDDRRRAYSEAIERLERLALLLRTPATGHAALSLPLPEVSWEGVESSLDRDAFCAGVERIRRHVRAGDVFQAVLSRRLRRRCDADPLTLYRALRALNPSPYMFCLETGEAAIVGASPEMLVRIGDGWIETRPIAGTRRRDPDPDADAALAEELLADAKERAEHLMLVDLGRNDVGRVSGYGSVRVPELMGIERYSHVMHIVSSVRGRLRDGVSPVAALFSCFPAGTVSGAPKIRAMEIINEIEGQGRGYYAGAVLYGDFSGGLNSCIAIRTVVLRDGFADVQAGAGIVMDSSPEREFEETAEKASAALQAIAWAESAVAGGGS